MLGQISRKCRLWPVLLLLALAGCERAAPPAPNPPPPAVTAEVVTPPAPTAVVEPMPEIGAPESAEPLGPPVPQLALVMDDLGSQASQLAKVMALPARVTLAFLPLPQTGELAAQARAAGYEVLLHMPMQPKGDVAAGTLAIRPELSMDENIQRLERALALVGPVVGINNHMGSLATADATTMQAIMPSVAARGLFFLDSRTSGASVAYATAKAAGVPALRRDIFLDDDQSPQSIAAQWRQALRQLRQQGQVVVIAHPHANTLKFLAQELAVSPRFYEIVPLANLLAERTGGAQ